MPQIKLSLAVLALAAVFVMSGCGDKNSQAVFSPETGHPAGWSAGHKTSGKAYRESCFECHGEELDGGISKVSCTTCHLGGSQSVHPLLWGTYAYARHASYIATNGTSTCANAVCHGTNLAGAGKIPSCTACHVKSGSSYAKHPAPWVALSDHATYLKSVKKTVLAETGGSSIYPTCSTSKCHGTDLKGVFLSGPSCYLCHTTTTQTGAISKHPATWTSALKSHGSFVAASGSSSCGTSVCHGTDFKGIVGSGPSCYNCHLSGPASKHPVNWDGYTKQGKASHGAYVKAKGYAGCATSLCHGTDSKGVTGGGPSCYTCHSSGPTSEHPVGWGGYTKQGIASHGLYVKAKGYTDCATSICHGTDAKGVAGSGTSCFSCHADGPTSEHPLTWTTSALRNHGSYAKTNGYTSCATSVCHGTDAKGVAGSGTSCYACHAAGPAAKHPTTWTTSALKDHGAYAKTNGYASCATAYCHGTDAQGGTNGSTAPSCYKCHTAGPVSKHPTTWTSARAEHAAYISSHTTYSCKTALCHASSASPKFTDPLRPECSQCHAN